MTWDPLTVKSIEHRRVWLQKHLEQIADKSVSKPVVRLKPVSRSLLNKNPEEQFLLDGLVSETNFEHSLDETRSIMSFHA